MDDRESLEAHLRDASSKIPPEYMDSLITQYGSQLNNADHRAIIKDYVTKEADTFPLSETHTQNFQKINYTLQIPQSFIVSQILSYLTNDQLQEIKRMLMHKTLIVEDPSYLLVDSNLYNLGTQLLEKEDLPTKHFRVHNSFALNDDEGKIIGLDYKNNLILLNLFTGETKIKEFNPHQSYFLLGLVESDILIYRNDSLRIAFLLPINQYFHDKKHMEATKFPIGDPIHVFNRGYVLYDPIEQNFNVFWATDVIKSILSNKQFHPRIQIKYLSRYYDEKQKISLVSHNGFLYYLPPYKQELSIFDEDSGKLIRQISIPSHIRESLHSLKLYRGSVYLMGIEEPNILLLANADIDIDTRVLSFEKILLSKEVFIDNTYDIVTNLHSDKILLYKYESDERYRTWYLAIDPYRQKTWTGEPNSLHLISSEEQQKNIDQGYYYHPEVFLLITNPTLKIPMIRRIQGSLDILPTELTDLIISYIFL